MVLLATVVIDPPSIAAAAALFTLAGARAIRAAAAAGLAALRARERRDVFAGALLGGWFALCFGYTAIEYPAWMLCYLASPAALPVSSWYPVFFVVLAACGAGGALGAHRLIAEGRTRRAWLLAAALLVAWGALFALTFDRYVHVGSFEQYWQGTAPLLREQPAVLRAFNLVGALTAAGIVLALAVRLWRGRRLPGTAGG